MRILSGAVTAVLLLSVGAVAAPRGTGVVAEALAWDAVHGRVWAGVAGQGPHANSVVAIDPATGAVGPSLPVGGAAGPLAVSDDGSTLYVGVASASVVRRFDLGTLASAGDIALGTHPSAGPRAAIALTALPGTPNSVAIARAAGATGDVAIYDAGVQRPAVGAVRAPRLEASKNGTQLYATDPGVSPNPFHVLAIGATGVASVASATADVLGFDFAVAGPLAFWQSGWITDPAQASRVEGVLRTDGLTAVRAVEIDVSVGEVALIAQDALRLFDLGRLAPLGEIPLGLSSLPHPGAVRWATRSFAISQQQAEVVLVDAADFVADADLDRVDDASDNCANVPNAGQADGDGDGAGDPCDSLPGTDLVPGLHACGADLTAQRATNADLQSLQASLVAARSQASADLAQCLDAHDADRDGETDAGDRCPGTPIGDFADTSGCSRAQFCAQQRGSSCSRADWVNDAHGAKRPFDCRKAGSACVPY
ncbi:MAG TPA: hypothetical protein VII78_09425 [Myxococcota bacterium]|jgi:hypothetical protein